MVPIRWLLKFIRKGTQCAVMPRITSLG